MALDELNQAAPAQARSALERCCGARAWVEEMVASRPFRDPGHLRESAARAWWSLGPDDWREAFTHHPRIGDLESLKRRFAATADLASREQGAVARAASATLEALAEGNRAYEERFGYIFIVCASGRSAEEMLAMLRQRLGNDADTEIRIAAGEQMKITGLRLGQLLGDAR
jgi:2-oxo-4-hydroxy-4-carboxy-5-ureidoimidazoline decarboxylase